MTPAWWLRTMIPGKGEAIIFCHSLGNAAYMAKGEGSTVSRTIEGPAVKVLRNGKWVKA